MKDRDGVPIEVTFERSFAPLRLGNEEEARLASMNQRFERLAREIGQDLVDRICYPTGGFGDVLDRVHKVVELERDQLKVLFNKLISKESQMIVVKEDDLFWEGVVILITQWIRVHGQFPYTHHPEGNSIGLEMALETLCTFHNVDSRARSESLAWLEPYLPGLEAMTDERDELYVDAVIAASSKENHELLLKVRDQLPLRLEHIREQIDQRRAEF